VFFFKFNGIRPGQKYIGDAVQVRAIFGGSQLLPPFRRHGKALITIQLSENIKGGWRRF